MKREEKVTRIAEALDYTTLARKRILPLSYENGKMADEQAYLLQAAKALEEWQYTLQDNEKHVYGNEKRYIMCRLQRVKNYLDDQRIKYDAEYNRIFTEAEEASEYLEKAIEALS